MNRDATSTRWPSFKQAARLDCGFKVSNQFDHGVMLSPRIAGSRAFGSGPWRQASLPAVEPGFQPGGRNLKRSRAG